MKEVVMSEKTAPRTSATSGFVALLLLTAGVLVLAGRVVPAVGDSLALAVGIELLVWAGVTREDGLLVAGGATSGIGLGVLLAAWPLRDAEPNVVGGAFVVAVAAGFLLVAILGQWWQRRQVWAWITALVAAAVGAALMTGAEVLGQLIEWGGAAALLAAGAVVGYRWLRSSRV
jgi:hypothetical protein